ncbi:hypothetical protein DXG03_005897 [Asterophora parasitica]|uniref:aspartate kinase n=1 Tax=Asterophora parasitica TaxID=117018 RepID=A0A9P7G7V1_9AGAR|nr:hypothetical protein DXG03_005897 [Asterophora parasitica]
MSSDHTPSSSPSSQGSSNSFSPPRTPLNLHQNSIDPSAKWLVQKFGGTSVGKFAVKIAEDIVANYIDQHKVAIVCSARSGSTKALGTTNLLLRSASQTLKQRRKSSASGTTTPVTRGLFGAGYDGSQSPPLSPQVNRGRSTPPAGFSALTPLANNSHSTQTLPEFNATVDIIRDEHVKAANASVRDPRILEELLQEIENDCDWLRNFLFAAQGIDAEYVSLEDIVPESEEVDTDVGSLDQEFYDRLANALGERIQQCGPRVPVVTGFFGPVPGSLLSQVGRGYTDLCSALLAVGLEAAELQIWKEVDGIFTADPRKVPTARLLSIITPDEAAELTYYGSEVVHPFTMEQARTQLNRVAIRRKIPIRIKNVENPKGGGTVIYPDPDVEAGAEQELPIGDETVPLVTLHHLPDDRNRRKRLPTAVTIKEHIIVLNVNSNRKSVSHGFLAGIFGTLDQYNVVVDLISTSEVHVSMAIEDGLAKKVLDRLIKELKKNGTVSVHRNMAILSLVGKEMRNMVGIAGKMFTTLAQGNVNIEMISQGASEINISCVIEAKDSVKALNLIHQSCLQIMPEGVIGRKFLPPRKRSMAEAQATFKEIPEIFEVELGEALTARTETLSTFRELGPPDLCHVVKNTGRSGQRDLGSYHYISGVDASSSASLAAYINSLTYAIEDNSAWFSKNAAWKVRNGCYCCFNAFSRVDVRVDVKIPGGVNAYVIDLRGERHEATPEIWQETYVSAILRAILYSDDPTYSLEAYRKLDPITTPEGEIRFLQAAEALFLKGWQVGSDPEIQVATVVSNHLTAGILKYFGDSGRYQQAANLFEKLTAREPEVASLLAKSYIGMNEEVKAVQIMAAAMKQTPHSYTLLHVQSDFLRSKGKYEWALKVARQAVNCAPSEFVAWEKVTELYIDLRQYESALLTLNSVPMFTFNGRDAHRTLAAAKINLPFTRSIGEILPDRQKTEDDEADPALQRLPAPGLRGTWARAYCLLTRLVSQIGWDELLKIRSSVFVMEEEYRMQKARGEINQVVANTNGTATENEDGDAGRVVIHEDGTVAPRPRNSSSPDDNASTRGILSTKSSIDTSADSSTLAASIPVIRVSTESDREREEEDISRAATPKVQVNGESETEENGMESVDLEKPVQAAAGEGEQTEGEPLAASTQEPFSFSNKRLCERWLDNLFMVLYEASSCGLSSDPYLTMYIQDLRVWTIFRAEVAHFKTQHVAYRKTGLEWEILGDLGLRLHHKEEAKEAYQRCLDSPRYSAKPWLKLMETYADEGDIQRSIQTAIRVAAYQYAEYTEMTYPTAIARSFFKLGQIHGHDKISFTLMSMGLPDPILKIMDSYLHYGKVFKIEGYDF